MSKPKWTDLEVVLDLMKNLTVKLGCFPSSKKLKELGYGGLLSAIYRHHKGMNNIRKLLGNELPNKPHGYYEDFNNIKKHIDEAMAILGHVPSIIELEKLNPGIKYGIRIYHGGYRKTRDLLGFEQLSAPIGYWKNKENVKKELESVINITGYFPSYNDMQEIGKIGLYTGINNCYGSLDECRKALDYPLSSKSKLEKRVKRVLDVWIETQDYVDNLRNKLNIEYNVLLKHPITNNPLELDRYYFNERIAIEIQGEQHYKETPHFKGKLEELLEVDQSKKMQLEKQGIMLIEITYKDTNEEIISKVKPYFKLLDIPRPFEIIKDSYEFYKDAEVAREGLLKIVEKYPEKLFTSDLIKNENLALYTAIKKFHGGINGGRELINIAIIREKRNSWSFYRTINELKRLQGNIGHFPTKKDILAHNPKLYYAAVKHGGLRELRKIF